MTRVPTAKRRTTKRRIAKRANGKASLGAVLERLGHRAAKRAPANAIAYLAERKVPPPIAHELEACTFADTIEIGGVRLFPLRVLRAKNVRFGFRRAVKHGFLIVGEGPNGDAIAVELATGKMAFLSHDVLLEFDPDCNTFDECVARTKLPLGVFFDRASREESFPCDFYGAGGA